MSERDPIVAEAIRRIVPPEHGPGFWEALDARLAAEDAEQAAAERAADDGERRVDTGELPAVTALRPPRPPSRRERFRYLVAAAAVIVVAVGVALQLGTGDDGDDPAERAAPTTTVPAPPPASSTTLLSTFEATTSPFEPPSGDGGDPVVLGAPTPFDAVTRFNLALHDGDLETAEALLGPMSRRHLVATGQDPLEYLVVLEEGFGAWAAAEDVTLTPIDVPDAGEVVVLEGRRPGEGGIEYHVQAVPTVEHDGRWVVEPAAFGGSPVGGIDVLAPEPGPGGFSSMRPDGLIRVDFPATAFWFSLDGGPPTRVAEGVFDPPGDLAPRTHLLVVAAVGDDVFAAVAGHVPVE